MSQFSAGSGSAEDNLGIITPGLSSPPNIDEHSPNSNNLKCVYANVQSIFNKKHEIEIYNRNNKFDMMFFTESFILFNE